MREEVKTKWLCFGGARYSPGGAHLLPVAAFVVLGVAIVLSITISSSAAREVARPVPVDAARLQLPDGPYSYAIVEQRLPAVLREFGANLGLPIEISDEVDGLVRGPWPELTARQFLARLESTFGLQSYYDGRVLHISTAKEARSEMLRLKGVAFEDVEAELDSLGLLDPDYSLRPAPNGMAALAYGPPRFLELVKQTILVLSDREAPAPPRRRQAIEIIRGYTAERP